MYIFFVCVGGWLKSSLASVICIITLKIVSRAVEAGFSTYFFPNGKIYQPNISDYY